MNYLVLGIFMIPFFISGCVGEVNNSMLTSVGYTQTAFAITPTPVNTASPFEGQILSLINMNLQIEMVQDAVEQLEHTVGASYTVVNANFVNDTGQALPNKLKLHVRCECANNGDCCNAEHTFVEISEAMKASGATLISLVPDSIHEFVVVCYDHKSLMGTLIAPWQAMKEFINGSNGYQLGGVVYKASTQTP